jgi:hypothetical protein
MKKDNLVGSDIKSSDAIVDSNATKSSDAIVDPSQIKSSDAIVDQPKSSDANRYCHYNNNLSGHIPSGNAPGEAIDCSHSVGIDHHVLHRYFNATTDWQKYNINTKVIEYTDLLVKYLLQRSHYTEGTSLFQFPHYDFDREIGRISVYGSKPKKQESLVQVILDLFKPYNVDITGNNIKQKVSLMTLNFDFDKLIATKNEQEAREISSKRQQLQREQGIRTHKHITLDEIGRRLAIGNFKELKVIKASLRDTTIPKDWDRIVGYYYPFYPAIMERLFKENGHPVDIKAEIPAG